MNNITEYTKADADAKAEHADAKAEHADAKAEVFNKIFSNISDKWKLLLNNNINDIIDILKDKSNLTPRIENVFEFARLTDFDNIKIVIIGQDPYPKSGHAHGLAFSCLKQIPASLLNIYKCLIKHKIIRSMPESGNLENWAKQGVLLVNTALTTEIGKANEHSKLWENYTTTLFKNISEIKPIVFMLWGNHAKKIKPYLSPKAVILEWAHPSPLAQSKQSFLDCPHFIDSNNILTRLGYNKIDWNIEIRSDIEKQFSFDRNTQIVFTDGSCYPNKACKEAKAGYAASFALGTMQDVILYGCVDNSHVFASNQRAEGTAILKTLEYLDLRLNDWETVIIVSDSEFWIKMIEVYMPSWVRYNTNFEEKKNPDLTKKIWTIYYKLINFDMKTIQFRHIKSHNKNGWADYKEGTYEYFCYINNDYADNLASFARKLKNNEHCISKAKY
jgi:uracil-DNA glycosylase